MKELVIISGKGGTGKTSITAAFAALAENAVLADCDVDAADLHLILQPDIKQHNDFVGGKIAVVNPEKCTGCGYCFECCKFNAVKMADSKRTFEVDEHFCEGCKVCVEFCPVKAIDFVEAINGQWFVSNTRFGPMVHARLGIAEENSGKLVSLIRKEAKKIAAAKNKNLLIVDGSPGTGCPVIASIGGADLVLVVTEPTLSGQHDLKRVIELTKHFDIPTAVCINKYDINKDIALEIAADAETHDACVLGMIRYDKAITKAQMNAQSIVEYSDNGVADDVRKLWNNTKKVLETI